MPTRPALLRSGHNGKLVTPLTRANLPSPTGRYLFTISIKIHTPQRILLIDAIPEPTELTEALPQNFLVIRLVTA